STELWHEVETGAWRVVDRLDRDEHRYLLALVTAPSSRAITRREQEVVEYASRGWSNKVIAYELGVATSTVSTHLAHAAAKLGLSSRGAVIQTYLAATRPQADLSVTHHISAGQRFAVIAIPLRSALLAPLSSAEGEVVAAVLAGKSNAEIADARGLSRRTIENQLASAMKKLGTG